MKGSRLAFGSEPWSRNMSAELWCGEVHPHASGVHFAVPPHQMNMSFGHFSSGTRHLKDNL